MNIKKSGGGGSTNDINLEDVARRDYSRISTEIRQCDPDIIIACGLENAGVRSTYNLLTEYVFPEDEFKPCKLLGISREWNYHYCEINGKSVPLVEFYHPNLRYLDGKRGHAAFKVLYEDMITIRENLLK